MNRPLAAMIGFVAGMGPAIADAQTNIDQGKTPAQIFASNCAGCHKLTRRLAHGKNRFLCSPSSCASTMPGSRRPSSWLHRTHCATGSALLPRALVIGLRDWLARYRRGGYYGNVGAGFLTACLAHGDIPCVVGDGRLGVAWAVGLTSFDGKQACEAWRRVLDGQLLAPSAPTRRASW